MSQLVPERYALAGRRIPLLETFTDPGYTAGSKASITIVFSSTYPATNSTLTLTWGGGTEVRIITFVVSPNTSGLQFPVKGAFTVDEYAVALLYAFLANPDIPNEYDVSYTVTGGTTINILLTAKQEGSYWNITAIAGAGSNITSTPVSGSDPVYSSVSDAILRVFVERDFLTGGFDKVFEGSTAFRGIETREFDIAPYIRPYLDVTMPRPANVVILRNHLRRFYLSTGIRYGAIGSLTDTRAKVYPNNTGDPEYARYGHCIIGGNDFERFFLNEVLSSRVADYQFLSRFPNISSGAPVKKILMDSPEFLCWFNFSEIEPTTPTISSVSMILTPSYSDGTTGTPVTVYTFANSPGTLLCFPITPGGRGMNLSIPSGKVLAGFNVYLEDQAGRTVSEQRYYEILNQDPARAYNRREIENPAHFIFLNSAGGWDTLIVDGDITVGMDIDRSFTRQYVSAVFNPNDTPTPDYEVTFRHTRICRTLPMSNAESQWISEFMVSKYIYMVNVLYPQNKTNYKIGPEMSTTGDQLTTGQTKYQFTRVSLDLNSVQISRSKRNQRQFEFRVLMPENRLIYNEYLP